MSMQVMTVQIIVFSVLVIWPPDMGFLWCVAGSRIPGLSILRRSLLAMLWLVLRTWDGWWFCCSFRVLLLVELFRHLAGLSVWRGGFPVASERLQDVFALPRVHVAFRWWYAAHVGPALAPAFPQARPVTDGACFVLVAACECEPCGFEVEVRIFRGQCLVCFAALPRFTEILHAFFGERRRIFFFLFLIGYGYGNGA